MIEAQEEWSWISMHIVIYGIWFYLSSWYIGFLINLATQSSLQFIYFPQLKYIITSAMKDSNNSLRLLLATEAYGMGTDAPDVRRIVHITPPATIESKLAIHVIYVHDVVMNIVETIIASRCKGKPFFMKVNSLWPTYIIWPHICGSK